MKFASSLEGRQKLCDRGLSPGWWRKK